MFATNQNQNDNMSYYNNLKPFWANQPLKEEDEENVQNIPYNLSNNETWKTIGSPPRRMSISGLQQQMIDDKINSKGGLLGIDDFPEVKRRNRAISTPVQPMFLNNELLAYQLNAATMSPASLADTKTDEALENYYAIRQAQQRQQQQQWKERNWSPSQGNSSTLWNQEMSHKTNTNSNSVTEEDRGELSEKSGSYALNNGSHPSTPVALPTPPMVTLTTADTATATPAATSTINLSSLPSTPESQSVQISEGNETKDTDINSEKEAMLKQKPNLAKIRINTNLARDGKVEIPENKEVHSRFRSSSISVGSFNVSQLQPTIQEADENQLNRQAMSSYMKPNNLEVNSMDMSRNNLHPAFLSTLNYEIPKTSRSRSKSSSEVYGRFSEQNLANLINSGIDLNGANFANNLGGMNGQLWRNNNNYNLLQALMANSRNGQASASLINNMSQMSSLMGNDFTNIHRRSTTQPAYSNVWGTTGTPNCSIDASVNNPTSPVSPTMPNVSSIITSPIMSPNHVAVNNNGSMLSPQANYFQGNAAVPNFSLTSPTSQTANVGFNRYGLNEEALKNEENRRRDSMSGSLYASLMNAGGSGVNGNNNTSGGDASSNDEAKKALSNQGSDYVNEIDDYFENTEHRTRAWVEAGKNLQNQQSSQHWPLYIVEFKAGRTDYFYISEKSGLVVKVNDLVIVEADRGKDLGKVVASNITSLQQIQAFQAQHAEDGMEIQKDMQIHPKRIYRLAQKAEIDMLIAKCQDEVKSKNLCQAKVRQKKLPMEIVDAEFQWDRKKLTFYFVSDRRIDFRELVRELFKIYKTRIWMCAVSSIPN